MARNLLITLRPGQWTKNLLVFAGVLFGRRLLDPSALVRALAAFVIFCALSGVVYLINDVADREINGGGSPAELLLRPLLTSVAWALTVAPIICHTV